MKRVKGNLIDLAEQGEFDLIVHGCNCFNTMGAGIAKEIKQRYPQVYKADLATAKGDRSKLGTITHARCGKFYIVNAYTQFNYGNSGFKLFDNQAFEKCLDSIKRFVLYGTEDYLVNIGFPLIGCGLAGANPSEVIEILEDWETSVDDIIKVTLVEFGGN